MKLGAPLKFQETATFKQFFDLRGEDGKIIQVLGEFEIRLSAPARLLDELTADDRDDLRKLLATRVASWKLSVDLENENGEPMTADRLDDVVALLRANDALFESLFAWVTDTANFLKG